MNSFGMNPYGVLDFAPYGIRRENDQSKIAQAKGLLGSENQEAVSPQSLLSTYQDPDYDVLYGNISLPKGFELRAPYESELEYFAQNPSVSGMATEDGKIILNKFSKLSPQEFQSVAINEAARLLMRNDEPKFTVPDYQREYFSNTPYEGSESEMKATIAARILSGDPSIANPTKEQLKYVEQIKKRMGM